MKKLSILICIILILCGGCSDKKQDIEQLIQNNKLDEAQAIYNNFSKAEKEDPKNKEIKTRIEFCKLSKLIKYYRDQNNYTTIDSLINGNGLLFKNHLLLNDSLVRIKKENAFAGASYYNSLKNTAQAYKCIASYVSDNKLDTEKRQLLNSLKEKAFSGIWYGKMISGKMKVQMKIEPVGNKSFTGRVLFEEMGVLCELYNGVIDGNTLTATYPINVNRFRRIMQGISGVYDNGKLTMTFPVVVTVTNSESDGGGGEFTTYESKIVRKECIMSKKKI